MKIDYRCPACILKVAAREAQILEPSVRLPFIREVVRILNSELDKALTPAHIAYYREILLQKFSGRRDPYKNIKHQLMTIINEKIIPLINEELSNLPEGYHRFRWLVLNSSAINGYEVPLYGGMDLINQFMKVIRKDLQIDHSEEVFDLISKMGSNDIISLILDNAHESPVDLLLVKYLKNIGRTVYVFARKNPSADDITYEELKNIYNSPYIFALESPLGVMGEKESEVNMNILRSSRLIIAKGMANYETLTEVDLGVPVFHLMTLKCEAVAESIGGSLGSPVALLRR